LGHSTTKPLEVWLLLIIVMLSLVLITICGSALGQEAADKGSSRGVETANLTRTHTGADLEMQEVYGKFVETAKSTPKTSSADVVVQESTGKPSESVKLTPTHILADLGPQDSALRFLSPMERQQTEAPASVIGEQRWAILWHQLSHVAAGLGSGRIVLALVFAAFLLFVGLWPSESANVAFKCLPTRGTASEGIACQLKKSNSMHGLLPKHNKIQRSSSSYGSLAAMSSKIRRSLSGNFGGLQSGHW